MDKHLVLTAEYQEAMAAVRAERRAQVEVWGVQRHPFGTGGPEIRSLSDRVRRRVQRAEALGTEDWFGILLEEVLEFGAETDMSKMFDEAKQVAAVAVAIMEHLLVLRERGEWA
jgi:hypothetical protein